MNLQLNIFFFIGGVISYAKKIYDIIKYHSISFFVLKKANVDVILYLDHL